MMAFNLIVLQSTWSIAKALVSPNQLHLASIRPPSKNGCGRVEECWNKPNYSPFSEFRLKNALSDDTSDTPKDAQNSTIPEKIRWVFDQTDGDFFDDEDDSFFDDLFLTDDEEDGGFITDDNEGPDASLNEDDLMRLHDMYPDINFVAAATNQSTVSNNQGSVPSPATETAAAATAAAVQENSSIGTTVSLDNILASLESDLSYFYLRDELGISEDVMWKITNDAPSVLGLKANNVRNKVRVLQSLVGFSDAEIRQLITSQPTLLQLSVKKNLSPSILYWIRQLQMGKQELKTLILGCPALLKYSKSNVHAKLMFFQTTMGYSLSECRKLLVKEPRLLTSSVKTGLIPRLQFLHKEVVISLPDIRTIVQKNPKILLMSVEQNLTPKCVFYFIMTLQMQTEDVGKLLKKYPQILDYNLEHHTLPIHHYFLSLDFSTYEFSRIIQKYPRLVTYSLIHIKRRIGYLRFELSLEANAIRRILYQCPQIVSLGQENIVQTVDFLLQAVAPGSSLVDSKDVTTSTESDLVETDDKDALAIVQILIAGLPTLLALSIEKNLSPKVEYLRQVLGQDELSSALLRMPALLGYSLEKRIRPRLERMLDADIAPGRITVAITLKEDAFDQWLQRQSQKENAPRRRSSKTTNNSVEDSPALTVPLINQLEETATETQTKSAEDDDAEDDGTANGGNSRVVEEGGKIIHWRRRR